MEGTTVVKKTFFNEVDSGIQEVAIISILNALRVPNIVQFLGVINEVEDLTIVLEFVDGETLENKLFHLINDMEPILVVEEEKILDGQIESKDTEYHDEVFVIIEESEDPINVPLTSIFQPDPFYLFPLEDRINAAKKILDTILGLHEAGFEHSDLHPGNIMIKKNYEISMIDFDKATPIVGSEVLADTVAYNNIAGPLLGIYPKDRVKLKLLELSDWQEYLATVKEADIAKIVGKYELELKQRTGYGFTK